MTTQDFRNIINEFEKMSLADLGWLIREAISIVRKKLTKDHGFSSDIAIYGYISNYPYIILIDKNDINSGSSLKDNKIYKI